LIYRILEFLQKTYGAAPRAQVYARIAEARDWWRGVYAPFHISTERQNGMMPRHREMYKMGMAKKVCEDWATVLVNDKTSLSTGDAETDRILLGDRFGVGGILTCGNFWGRLNAFVERVFALGAGAAVAGFSGASYDGSGNLTGAGEMVLEFLTAEQMFPLQVENGVIVSCAFLGAEGAYTDEDGRALTPLSVHERLEDGRYRVTNHCFDASHREEVLPRGVKKRFFSPFPLFAVLTPNIVSTDPAAAACGMGDAVFASAYDNLKGVDLAYNNFCRDLFLGGKKVFLNQHLIAEDKYGNRVAPDDVAQQLFMTVGDGDLSADTMIVEHNPELRAAENCTALQAQLDYLSFKVGFGTRHYRFSGDRVVTATQYAGERQEMFRQASKHYLHMEQFLRELVWMAYRFASGLAQMTLPAPEAITVDFDDSFFIDPAAERQRDLAEVQAGLMAPWEYRMKYYGESEETAKETLAAVR